MNISRTRSRVPTVEQQRTFLDMLRHGLERSFAARAAGSTASRFRSLAYREPRFAALVDEAEVEGRGAYIDKVRAEGRARAFDRRDPASAKFLEREQDAWLPEYEHRRVSRFGNAPGETLELGANARITREALENLPQETLDELIRLKEIEKAVMEGRTPPPRAIDVGGG